MKDPSFIHLRVHSDYSMLDGLTKIDLLLKQAALLNMPALAITDFTNLYGLIKFYNIAHNMGIKPIIGIDCFIKHHMFNNELMELTLLATNNIGYHNLIILISKAHQRGYGNIGPIIDRNWLIEHNKGLIVLSGGCKGDVGKYLIRGDLFRLKKCLEFYEFYFPERYYLELIRTGRQNEEEYLCAAVEISIQKKIPVVADNDVRFLNKEDFHAHEIRVAIHDGIVLDNKIQSNKYSSQQFMRSMQDMCEIFSDLKEALINSVEIARRCNVTINSGKYFLPKFYTGKMSTENYLIMQANKGLEERLKYIFPNIQDRSEKRSVYKTRLNSELEVINKMGFPGYFLIVMEFIQWSKDHDIPVGPGRGSGAGSLVAYVLKITDINPLSFNLLFERFLNPERISMPDFDIDFCMEKRDLVINHVTNTYGQDAVSQIITFGTMTAKAVIRDVGRVLGYSYSFTNTISKLIPPDPGITLERALIISTPFQERYKSDEEVKILIDMAKKLEGVVRNVGKHAGGIVIAPSKITDFMPLYFDCTGQNAVTQFDKSDVEYIGLVKFDFLGLRTLTIINKTLKMINKKLLDKKKVLVDISTVPLNDKKIFTQLKHGETTAIFQLESHGMKDLLKRLQPDCFEDIIALIALFRPGPLQSGMVDNFINRKHGNEKIYYPDEQWQHKALQPILESTYGIILYQEQVMQIAQILAGYTLGNADMLLRAMSKKKPQEMSMQRVIFQKGAKNFGIDGKLAMKIFDLVEKFAGYGFNKSHSTAYALISYQTLWLKTYYPAEFMAATMSSEMDDIDKIVTLIDECYRMKLKIIPPNINTSDYYFHVNEIGEIIYGMGAIKGIGYGPIEEIVKARINYGNFCDLFDLCMRIDQKKINRKKLEKLILSGACDGLGPHRAALINSLDEVIKTVNQYNKNEIFKQIDMFHVPMKQTLSLHKDSIPWSNSTLLEKEKEAIGLYLTSHPINQYLQEIVHYDTYVRLKDINNINQNKFIIIAGIILSKRLFINKQGNRIITCILDDGSGRINIILFPEILEKYQSFLNKNYLIIVYGQIKFDNFNNNFQLIVSKLMDITEARKKYVRKLIILLNYKQINKNILNRILLALRPYLSGTIPVDIYYQKNKINTELNSSINWRVILNDNLLSDLRNIVGNEQVKLKFNN